MSTLRNPTGDEGGAEAEKTGWPDEAEFASLLWSHSAAATLQLAACGLYNNNTSCVCGGVVMLRALCNARLTENLMSKNVEKYFGRFISPYD